MDKTSIAALLERYKLAKKAWDHALYRAFNSGGLEGKKPTEIMAKIAARDTLRTEGFEDPEDIRWEMRLLTGTLPSAED